MFNAANKDSINSRALSFPTVRVAGFSYSEESESAAFFGLISRSFIGTQNFRFLETRGVSVLQRLHISANTNFIRLFLANRVLSVTYGKKTRSSQLALFENLFYSVFFDTYRFEGFFNKGTTLFGFKDRTIIDGKYNL